MRRKEREREEIGRKNTRGERQRDRKRGTHFLNPLPAYGKEQKIGRQRRVSEVIYIAK